MKTRPFGGQAGTHIPMGPLGLRIEGLIVLAAGRASSVLPFELERLDDREPVIFRACGKALAHEPRDIIRSDEAIVDVVGVCVVHAIDCASNPPPASNVEASVRTPAPVAPAPAVPLASSASLKPLAL